MKIKRTYESDDGQVFDTAEGAEEVVERIRALVAKAAGAEATVIIVRMPDGSTMAQTWHADMTRAEWLADMASKARDVIWPDEDEEDAA